MTTKTTYKVGDKVRILDACKIMGGSVLPEMTEVIEMDGNGNFYLRTNNGHSVGLYIMKDELKYIEKVAEQVAKFKVGDKVKVVAASHGWGGVSKGDEGVIARINNNGSYEAKIPSFGDKITWTGTEECFELVSPKLTKNQRLARAEQAITALEQTVADLQAEVEALKAAQKIAIKAPTMTVKADVDVAKFAESLAKAIDKHTPKSPNEQRKAIIEEAKAFVEETLAEVNQQMGWRTTKIPLYKEKGRLHVNFHINEKKRTVTALAYLGNLYPQYKRVVGKAIAKCAPDDVFNADIGKAIALGRALGLDVERFEKSVQPSEVVVGMAVRTKYEFGGYNDSCPTNVIGITAKGYPKFKNGTYSSVFEIKDDTEAQY